MIGDVAGGLREAEALEDSTGGGEEGSWREAGLEWRGGTAAAGGRRGAGAQKLPWTKGWLRSTSAVGRHFSSTNTCRRKSLHASVTPSGSMGFVGCVAILNMAAMASYSAHGGFWVSISTTVQATLLYTESSFNLKQILPYMQYMGY